MTSDQATPTIGRGEIRALTGLRIVAAVWVVAFHFSFTPGNAYTALLEPVRPLIATGALGVDLFYVLSGFVITLTYLEKMGASPSLRGTVTFWWARICRVWPVYAVVTTLFGGWLLYKQTQVSDGFLAYQVVQPELSWWSYVQQLLMVQLWDQPYFDGVSFVGAAWSISAEWAAYTAFPLLVLLLFRLRRAPAVVTGALAVACMVPFAYICWSTGEPYYAYSWLSRIGAGFLAGAFTCLAVRRIRITPRVEAIAATVAVLAVLEILIGLWWGDWRGQGTREFGGVVVLVFPVLIGALALSGRGLSRVLASGPLVHGGRISYSLYLVHIPVFEVFWTYMSWNPRIAASSGLGAFLIPHVLLLTVLVAHLVYRYVEEPGRLWLRDRGPVRTRSTVVDPEPPAALPSAETTPARVPVQPAHAAVPQPRPVLTAPQHG